jgi:hypothetical protein
MQNSQNLQEGRKLQITIIANTFGQRFFSCLRLVSSCTSLLALSGVGEHVYDEFDVNEQARIG